MVEDIYIVMQHNTDTGQTCVSEVFKEREHAEKWAEYMKTPSDNYIFYVRRKPLHITYNPLKILTDDSKK